MNTITTSMPQSISNAITTCSNNTDFITCNNNANSISWNTCKNDDPLISSLAIAIVKRQDKEKAEKAIKETIKRIKKIIFKNPATVIIWDNGEKTVVKCQNGEPFDEEKGLAMALLKHFFDNSPRYNDFFTKCEDKIERL